MDKIGAFFGSDGFLKVAALACVAAAVVKRTAAIGSTTYAIADGVEEACIVLGVSSTLGRAKK